MELKLLSQPPRLGRVERFVKGAQRVGREVVQDDANDVGLGVVHVDEFAHALRKVS